MRSHRLALLSLLAFGLCAGSSLAATAPAAKPVKPGAPVAHDTGSAASAKAAAAPLQILRMTPSGVDVTTSRQLVLEFNQDVVPVGDARRPANTLPVTIVPAAACEWRFLNSRSLACQLKAADAFRPATRYQVTVAPLKAVSGARMAKPFTASFTTARPQVTYAQFRYWKSPTLPLIRVRFNQPVTRSSVAQHLYIESGGRVALEVVRDDLPREWPTWMLYAGLDMNQPARSNDRVIRVGNEVAVDSWLVAPKKALGADADAALMVEPGLVTPLGAVAGGEKRTVVQFVTYPPFAFHGISCVPGYGSTYFASEHKQTVFDASFVNALLRAPGKEAECNPMWPVALVFTSPVPASEVKKHVTFAPRLDGGRTDYDPWANAADYSQRSEPHTRYRRYELWLPELLRANIPYRIDLPRELRDQFGRTLALPSIAQFRTTHRDPRLVIDYEDVVLEKDIDSFAISYVTNLDELTLSGSARTASGARSVEHRQRTANLTDISYKFILAIREILEGRSGVAWTCVSSTPAIPDDNWRTPCIFSQVTPFAVHAKLGHFNTLAWVTDMRTGEAVPDAQVEVLRGTRASVAALPPVGPTRLADPVSTDAQGVAMLPGGNVLDPQLQYRYLWDNRDEVLLVKVTRGDDIAVVPLDNSFEANAGNGIWPDYRQRGQHAFAWGFSAQGVYRAGDTANLKVYFRDQGNSSWLAPQQRKGYSLRVLDPAGTEVHRVAGVTLDAFGAWTGDVPISAQAIAGWYQVELRAQGGQEWQALRFLVSDFTPAPFKVSAQLQGDVFEPGNTVTLRTQASLYSGGPFANAATRTSARIEGMPYSPGTEITRGYSFGSWDSSEPRQQMLSASEGKLDVQGSAENRFKIEDSSIYYGRLYVESAVTDDRGKYVTDLASAIFVSRDRFVGIRTRNWLQRSGEALAHDLIVTDPKGVAVAGVPIRLALERRVIRSARVLGAGNAYLLHNTGDWEEAASCSVDSRTDGAVSCEVKPTQPGSYRLVATIKDSKGRAYRSELWTWVIGAGYVNWADDNNAGLEIVPEKDRVNSGSVARYLVKNPYPGARALITVERYGVIERYSRVFKDSTEVVEVPVGPQHAPGFYLSVVLASPRVNKPLENEIDLGKPAFRVGYVQTMVDAPDKKIALTLKTDREEYRPRQQVTLDLSAVLPAIAKDKPLSIALLAIDEAVLALNAERSRYYDAHEGFNRLDGLDVANYNLVARLIGRQKIEKKGANPGGDGGDAALAAMRDRFRYIAYWNADVPLDGKGRARVSFEVPDNLTAWKMIAVAVTPDDVFGLGETSVRVNRPTEIRPAMPNQVTEGDRFTARFTVMNRTKNARTLTVKINAKGPLESKLPGSREEKITLAAWEQKIIELPVQVKAAGEVRFTASAGDSSDSDALAHTVPVKARRIREVMANYGSTVENSASDNIAIPLAIYPDASTLSVSLAPTVIGNLDGAFRYVRDYPYLCWEQRLAKGLMYASSDTLRPWLKKDDLPADPKALVQQMLADAAAFQAPNGGMTYWQARDDYVSPYLSAYTALAFRWLARDGYDIPAPVQKRLHDYLRNMLRTNVFPTFFDAGMSSSVRAVALAALADANETSVADVARYAPQLPQMALFGKVHFLQAQTAVGSDPAAIQRTLDAILGMSNQSGGKFQFVERLDDGYSELLATPLRENCAALSALLRASGTPGVGAKITDIPFKLVRMITQARGNRDHFENTQENVFCMNALIDYAKVYERDAPAMTVNVKLDSEKLGNARFNSVQDPQVLLKRPLTAADPGRKGKVLFEKDGAGRFYYSTRLEFAPKDEIAQAANNGIEVKREYSVKRNGKWVLLGARAQLQRGDLLRVDLYIDAPGARHYVVVDDPVPGGLEPVNTDLATDSTFDDNAAASSRDAHSWWFSNRDGWTTFGQWGYSFYHREIRHDAVRFYADLLPAGRYHLSYAAQVIASGEFAAQPTHAGEMYDIDVFGRGLPARFTVDERKP